MPSPSSAAACRFRRSSRRFPLKGLREGSLQQTLRAAGLIADHGEEWVDIEMLSKDDAAILAVRKERHSCARGD